MAKQTKAEKQAALAAKGAEAATTTPAPEAVNSEANASQAPAAEAPAAEASTGKIKQIIALHVSGKTNAEIKAEGFHPTTISIQTNKYMKIGAELIGKSDEDIIKAGYTPEYIAGLQARLDKKATDKKARQEAAAQKLKEANEKKAAAAKAPEAGAGEQKSE